MGTVNPTSKQYRPRDQALTPAAGADRVGTFIPASCPIAPVFPAECDASNESEDPAKHRSVPSALRQFIHMFVHISHGALPTRLDYVSALLRHGGAFPELRETDYSTHFLSMCIELRSRKRAEIVVSTIGVQPSIDVRERLRQELGTRNWLDPYTLNLADSLYRERYVSYIKFVRS